MFFNLTHKKQIMLRARAINMQNAGYSLQKSIYNMYIIGKTKTQMDANANCNSIASARDVALHT